MVRDEALVEIGRRLRASGAHEGFEKIGLLVSAHLLDHHSDLFPLDRMTAEREGAQACLPSLNMDFSPTGGSARCIREFRACIDEWADALRKTKPAPFWYVPVMPDRHMRNNPETLRPTLSMDTLRFHEQ